MNRVLIALLFLPACFDEAPPVGDDAAAEDDGTPQDGDSSSEVPMGSESSSGDGPADPLDAYGPCEVDTDCEIVPGDKGESGDSVRCVQGTCAIRCADASSGGVAACPGYYDFPSATPQTAHPFACQDGYCTVQFDPHGAPGSMACPEGMETSDTETVPDLDCVWEP